MTHLLSDWGPGLYTWTLEKVPVPQKFSALKLLPNPRGNKDKILPILNSLARPFWKPRCSKCGREARHDGAKL